MEGQWEGSLEVARHNVLEFSINRVNPRRETDL